MTRKLFRLAPALLAVLLAGCGTPSGIAPVPAASTEVTRTVEKDGRFLAFVGPRRQHAAPFLGVPSTNFYALRSWIDTRTGETVHQLYVEDSYAGATRRWSAARDGRGQPLRLVEISRTEITCEGGCSYAEEFAAALPEPLLRQSAQGLTVTFTANSGAQKTIAVPGELVQKQLAAVDAARAPRPAAAAPGMAGS
jgi:hypothetical protein